MSLLFLVIYFVKTNYVLQNLILSNIEVIANKHLCLKKKYETKVINNNIADAEI